MDLAKTNCFGPPIITVGHALLFGLVAAVFLVGTWRRFGTAAVLAPWGVLAVAGTWLLVLRLEMLYAFVDGWWWSPQVAAAGIQVVLTPLLATLASAVAWGILPRESRLLHVGLGTAQFLIAFFLASTVAAGVEAALYEWA